MAGFGDTLKGIFNMGAGYDEYDDYDDDYDFDDYDEPQPKKTRSVEKKVSEPIDDVEPDFEDDIPEEPVRAPKAFGRRSSRSSKVVSMENTRSRQVKAEILTIKPFSLEDSKDIVDALLAEKAILINFEGTNTDLAQRIIDSVSGACCAVNGTLKKVSSYIYIVAPTNIDLVGDYNENQANNNSYDFRGNRYQF